MIRQTSLEAYREIEANGLLSRMRWEIYQTLFQSGPMTAREVFGSLKCETNQSGRFTEMRDLGVIQEVGVKKCDVTGNNVILWDVTHNLPRRLERKPTKAERAARLMEILTNNNTYLKERVKQLEHKLRNAGCMFCQSSEKRDPKEGVEYTTHRTVDGGLYREKL